MPKSRRTLALVVATLIVAVIAAACAAIPVPLPFQASAPASEAKPAGGQEAGAVGKPAAQGKPGGGGGAGVPVVVVPAAQGRIGQIHTFSGTVAPVQQTNLVPKTQGRIEKILVEVGDQVKSGQTLVQLDRGTLDTAVKQAEANVLTAQARVTTVTGGPRKEDVEVARAQLESARARLRGMESGGRTEDITSAQAAVQSAQARLQQVQAGSREADLKTAEQQLQAAQATFNKAVADSNRAASPSPDELAAARATADKARAVLQVAQSNYDRIAWRPDAAGRAESIALQSATADYESAAAQLRLRESPRAEDVAASERSVDAARAQIEAAKARLDQLKTGASAEDLQIATSTLIQAQQTLAKARQPFTEQDVEAQRQAVLQAEQTLSLRSNPFTESDVQTARAQLAQAQAALEAAKVNALEGAIVAPYDGVVLARPLAEGALTNAQTAPITIASAQVEIVLNVDEARVGQLKAGQPATLALTAFPGKTFPAKVVSIAPSADARTHTFPVRVRPEPAAAELRAGMFAEVKVVTEEKPNAVLLPKEALIQRGGKAVVFVAQDGRAKQVEVPPGLSDDKNLEAPAGITAGDQIIVAGQATVNDGDPVRIGGGAGAPGKPEGGAPGKPQGGAAKPSDAAAKPSGTPPAKP
jgi:HlyD family secretion protein